MKKNRNDIWVLVIGYVVMLVIIITLASSCSPQRKMWNMEQKHPELLLQYCASKAIADTIVIPGGVRVDTQTITLNCDTVTKTDTFSWQVVKKVPVYSHTTDTFLVNQIDTSGKALLRSENSDLQQQKDKLQGKLSAWQFWAILGWLLVVLLAVGIGFLIKWK